MSDWQFESPWFLLVGLVALPVIWTMRRSRPTLAYSSVAGFASLPTTWRSRLSFLPRLLIVVAILLFAIALARPQTADDSSNISREGIAIMLVVDRSGSMDARDLEREYKNINRLEVVKDVLLYFLTGNDELDRFDSITSGQDRTIIERGRPNDMIGLVTFAAYADSMCPLTLDHGNLFETINQLELATDRTENGTAIGDGLGLAVERLRRSPIESKIVILLTDGVNNRGELDPLKAGDLAASEDIKVYCIGAGTNGYAPFPVRNPLTGEVVLQAMQVEIDEESLQAISEKTGGKYFRATDKSALKKIYDEIDQLEKTEVSELKFTRYHEHFHEFVLGGVFLLAAGWLLQATWCRSYPG